MARPTHALLAGLIGLAAGAGVSSCRDDYQCGERNLPGTEGCPCLSGERCVADLICAGGACISERPGGTGGTSGTGGAATTGSDTGTGGATGTGSGSAATSASGGSAGSDTGTGG